METAHLSQKLSQLSTTTSHVNDNEASLKEIQIDLDKLPDYLTKRNQAFQHVLSQIILTTSTIPKSEHKDKIEELRKITILTYKIRVIQLNQHLWTHYLKAGVGQLMNQTTGLYSTSRPIWPKEIKTMVQSKMQINPENEYELCFHFVQQYIQLFDKQLKNYQHELNMKIDSFAKYSIIIQKQIQIYIEQNLTELRQQIEHQVALIYYDYHIHAIKLAFCEQQPNSFQEQLMKDVCKSQYEYEACEQELKFLKQKIQYYSTSPNHSFEQSKLVSCSIIETIEDPIIRQQLFQQLKQTAEQARAEIFNLSLTTAQQQRNEYKQKYDVHCEKLFSACRSTIETEKLSQIMVDLIHRRCQKISERIQCIYQFKLQVMMMMNKS